MKVQVESISAVHKKLFISIPEEDVQGELAKAYRSVSANARIPGFRPGKVPRDILEKRFGASIEADVYQDLVKNTVSSALAENNIEAIHIKEISEPKREPGVGFSYTAWVEVKPEFEVKDYVGVELTNKQPTIGDTEIQHALEHLRESQAVLKPVNNVLTPKQGHFVSLVIEDLIVDPSKTSGEPPREQLYEIGNAQAIPALDEALLQMQLGATSPVTLPGKDKEQPSKSFRITLKQIKEKILPPLDDDLAKSVGAFASLTELKQNVQKELEQEARNKAREDQITQLLQHLRDANPIDLPESMVTYELHQMIERLQERMKWSGIETLPPEYTHEKLEAEMLPDAQKSVHEQLLLDAIAKKEDIEALASEVDERLATMSNKAKLPVHELRSYYEKSGRMYGLRYQILAEKTLDFLLAQAKMG